MKSINFRALPIRMSISSSETVPMDAAEQLANLIYTQTSGVASHALALKIFNAADSVGLDDSEVDIVKDLVSRFCTPAVIDSINAILDKTDEQTSQE